VPSVRLDQPLRRAAPHRDGDGALVPRLEGEAAERQALHVQKLGASFFRLTGRWHLLHRVIDRRNNRYYERIEDEETGEVVRLVEEPLTEHQGRGDARRKRR
jgi:hypothetical protein